MNLLVNSKQNTKAIKILVFGFIFNFLLTSIYRSPVRMLEAVILQHVHSPYKMMSMLGNTDL